MTNGPPTIFSPTRREARAARARALQGRPDAADWLAESLVEDTLERIDFMRLAPRRALAVGAGANRLAAALEAKGARVVVTDAQALDHEKPWPVGEFDLIASLGTLATVNDLPGALIHLRGALRAGGIAIASMIGAGSLPRLRSALLAADAERPAARLHPAVDAQAGAALLQRAGFSRQVSDSWTLRLRYSSLDTLVADLRAQGLTSTLADSAPPLTKSGLERARAAFLDGADSAGKVVETLEVLTLTGWKN
ncbi:methyltransferase domain-containing protein [Tsuneonella mangrovi]|uniref:methyltransferase domain-containing protein n=1 Tax=Tsuneonella mangrovi TaxID=1982042 RepID=UPI000BA1CCD4|nr:methyltransferase domain-containing protein [Tsuneonella mangrovi]